MEQNEIEKIMNENKRLRERNGNYEKRFVGWKDTLDDKDWEIKHLKMKMINRGDCLKAVLVDLTNDVRTSLEKMYNGIEISSCLSLSDLDKEVAKKSMENN